MAALKLIVENDKNELNIFEFSGNLITVGRGPKNDLVLDERNVSRYHFQLEIVDGRIVICDCKSYNHTFVNERELFGEKLEIFVGDIITVGDYNIYLEQDEEEEAAAQKAAAPVVESEGLKVAQDNLLLVKNGYLGGKIFPLTGRETVIGSHASADVYLFAPDIPALHSKLIFDGNMYLLVKGDYKGNYPLIVNDMEVRSVDMRNGDEIKVGDFIIEFVEKGAEYDPMPYQLVAEEARKEKLREDIKSNKIKNIREEEKEEPTEITRLVKDKKKKGHPVLIFVIAGVVIAAAVLAYFFFFRS